MSVVHAPSLSASKITKAELDSLQTRYDQLIEDLTAQEDAKVQKHGRGPGELLILDRTRFNTIPQGLTKRKEEGPDKGFLEKEEIEELVRWKLKHGTFRPRLTQLVASNGEEDIERTTREAFKIYASNPNDYAVSINKLATLKGIGPATASLLLSVYDPENVPFFSDELFRWTCWDEKSGWGRKIRYDVKEYKELFEGVETVRERLKRESGEKEGFRAVDLEKGAFVLGREALAGVGAKRKSQSVGEAGEKRKSQSVGEAGENAIPLGSVTKKRRTSGRQQESKDDSFER